MQISDRLLVSSGGINIGYRYMPKTHIGTPLEIFFAGLKKIIIIIDFHTGIKVLYKYSDYKVTFK